MDQALEGINLAKKNSIGLYEDAVTLFEANSFNSSAALAILAIEEAGKPSIIRRILTAEDDKELKACWKDYRSHVAKNVLWPAPELMRAGKRRLVDMRGLFSKDSTHRYVLERIKQLAIYSDYLDGTGWHGPTEKPEDELREIARRMLEIAHILVPRRPETRRELELWLTMISTVDFRDWDGLVKAYEAYEKALHAEGITDRFNPEFFRLDSIAPQECDSASG